MGITFYFRCDKSLKISLFESHGEMRGLLRGLDSNDVVYIQQAATDVKIIVDRVSVHAEINCFDVSKKGKDVVNIVFDEDSYYRLKSKVAKKRSQTVSVHFNLKHSYFRNLHKSLDMINPRIIDCLIPDVLQTEQRLSTNSNARYRSLDLRQGVSTCGIKEIDGL